MNIPKIAADEVAERFSLREGIALHPAAGQGGGKAKAGAERAAEKAVSERSVEENAYASCACG